MTLWMLVTLVAIVALSFGPLLMLQPSVAERRQGELRNRAMQLGLNVSIGALPKQDTDTEAPGMMAIYRWSRHHSRAPGQCWTLLRAAYSHEQHFLQTWAWQGIGRPGARERAVLEAMVPRLPDSVLGLGADSSGWYAYWTESRHAGELECLYEALHTLSQAQEALLSR